MSSGVRPVMAATSSRRRRASSLSCRACASNLSTSSSSAAESADGCRDAEGGREEKAEDFPARTTPAMMPTQILWIMMPDNQWFVSGRIGMLSADCECCPFCHLSKKVSHFQDIGVRGWAATTSFYASTRGGEQILEKEIVFMPSQILWSFWSFIQELLSRKIVTKALF